MLCFVLLGCEACKIQVSSPETEPVPTAVEDKVLTLDCQRSPSFFTIFDQIFILTLHFSNFNIQFFFFIHFSLKENILSLLFGIFEL